MSLFHQTLEAIWNVLVENTVTAGWNSLASDDTTFTHEVFTYLTETPIKYAWDDFLENAICPWYHPWGSLKQVLIPFTRFFWELLGKSPVFWFLFTTFMLRWSYCDYYRYVVAVGGGETPSVWGWWRTKHQSVYLRVPRMHAPTPAENAPSSNGNSPAPAAEDTPVLAENA